MKKSGIKKLKQIISRDKSSANRPISFGAVILAGGMGTRMKKDKPKALVELLESPLIFYPIRNLFSLNRHLDFLRHQKRIIEKIGIVTGHRGDEVKNRILADENFYLGENDPSIDFAVQEKYLGTGDAVKTALSIFDSFDGESNILIMPCDMPLIQMETFKDLLEYHLYNGSDLTVLSVDVENPYSYGRVVRDKNGFVNEIVEEKEISSYPYPDIIRDIHEINSGVYAVKLKHLRALIGEIKDDNSKKEFYFTDIVDIFCDNGLKVTGFKSSSGSSNFIGVNSNAELQQAGKVMQNRIIEKFINMGVNFISTDNVYIGGDVDILENATIYPGVFLSGNTKIFSGARIESGCIIKDSTIESNCIIKSYSVIENSKVLDGSQIGPFAHLRPGNVIMPNAKIGNFVEVKNSFIGENSKASHLSYIGDSSVGKNVNIGAGVITCNYDGTNKYRTEIKDDCFIGSDSQLIAPVSIGKMAYVGSGTTVTKDVPDGALAVSRVPQKNIEGWVLRKPKGVKLKGE